jgi:anaerobic ribonucleoside-triphosphate reductase activating protein
MPNYYIFLSRPYPPAPVQRLLEQISRWIPDADGITISGGEPFEQPEALIALLSALRKRTSIDILVYSGYPIESLNLILSQSSGMIDALISDAFDLHSPHSRPLRGSDNQRLHKFTDLGRSKFGQYERELTKRDKSLA